MAKFIAKPWVGTPWESLGVRFAYVLHVGDFGVWSDSNPVDKATRKHDGAGDFPVWFSENRAAPRPTVFIKGNHEDFVWLEEQLKAGRREILPGLTYLPSGDVMDISESRNRILGEWPRRKQDAPRAGPTRRAGCDP